MWQFECVNEINSITSRFSKSRETYLLVIEKCLSFSFYSFRSFTIILIPLSLFGFRVFEQFAFLNLSHYSLGNCSGHFSIIFERFIDWVTSLFINRVITITHYKKCRTNTQTGPRHWKKTRLIFIIAIAWELWYGFIMGAAVATSDPRVT